MSPAISAVLDGKAPYALMLGDCLAPDGLPSLPKKCVNLFVTDPPYAVTNVGMWHIGRPGKGKRRFDFFAGDGDWAAIRAMVRAAVKEAQRVAVRPGSAYWWVGHREFGDVVDLYEEAGFTTRFLVWAKRAPSPPPPGSGWPSGAELCVYAFEPGRTWNHDGANPPPNNVFTLDSYRNGQPGKTDHPTQKPGALIEAVIFASSNPNDVICDPFTGSGTTGLAALHLGRRFVGWEKDPVHYETALRRLQGGEARPIPGQGSFRW